MAKNTDISYRNQMIYSIFVRQYGKNGTFKDVQDDLERIRSLGTDIIWLMPIHPIGEKNRKGTLGSPYAIKDYRGINPEFGTIADFEELVSAIHENGMKVIIDVVFRHTSHDSLLASEHPDWFYHKEDGSFGNHVGDWWDIIDLDLENPELRQYLIDTLVYWAGYVDGFRCDVASGVPVSFWTDARTAVEKVRPGAFWLAETVQPGLIRYMRKENLLMHSDGEMYEAFDACYDYDIYDEWVDAVTGRRPLSDYLRLLNQQEYIYPANYIKAHFLENHDQMRAAAAIPDAQNLIHWTAFSIFSKGIAMIYNGQERSAVSHPSLFEKEPVDWKNTDISDVIRRMMAVKRKDICAKGSFHSDELRHGLVKAEYSYERKRLIGLFAVACRNVSTVIDLEDGDYKNEYNGETLPVFHGIVTVGKEPIIIESTCPE